MSESEPTFPIKVPEGAWVKVEVTIVDPDGEVLFPVGVKRLLPACDLTNRIAHEIARATESVVDESMLLLFGDECFVFEYRGHWRWAYRSASGESSHISSEHFATRWEALKAADARGLGCISCG